MNNAFSLDMIVVVAWMSVMSISFILKSGSTLGPPGPSPGGGNCFSACLDPWGLVETRFLKVSTSHV